MINTIDYIETLRQFTYVFFSVSFAVYYLELIQNWPHIMRTSRIFSSKENWKNLKIILLSWPFLILILTISIVLVNHFFYNIDQTSLTLYTILWYGICSFVIFLIPRFSCGLIRGIISSVLHEEFSKKCIDSLSSNKTLSDLFYTEEYVKETILPKGSIRFGVEKGFGNLIALISCLSILYIANINYYLIIPFGLFLIASFLSIITKKIIPYKNSIPSP